MDYIFRMEDGGRLALWSEGGRILRMVSGEWGTRRFMVLRDDVLSDFSAAKVGGKIYFTYQNRSRMIMFYMPDKGEYKELFCESIESCRYGGLTLTVWEKELYLLYTSWNPIRKKYALKLQRPLELLAQGGDNLAGNAEERAVTLKEFDARPPLCALAENPSALLSCGEWYIQPQSETGGTVMWRFLRCSGEEERQGLEHDIAVLTAKAAEYRNRLDSAVRQYHELAETAKQLQEEGKRWREKYYQRVRKSQRKDND